MSLLWTRAMAWHNDDREDEIEGATGDYGFRDTRPYEVRRPELVKHIAYVHDVPEHAAGRALSLVEQGLRRNQPFGNTSEYGLGKHAFRPFDEFPQEHRNRMYRSEPWHHEAQEEDVPLKSVVPTQSWVRHSGVAHNLFHPEMHAPEEEGAEGDPDYDPEWDEDRREEAESGWDEEADGVKPPTRLPRFYRHTDGTVYSMDGHHRLAADAALGKTHVRGLVLGPPKDD